MGGGLDDREHLEAANADGFPVARNDLLVEDDPDVRTRLLGEHLVVFNCRSRRTDLVLRSRHGHELEPAVKPGWPNKLTVEPRGDEVALSGLVPGHLYLLRARAPE